MRNSSLLGLSVGWLIASLAMAFDVGTEDLLFFPSLALGLPALLGLTRGVQMHRRATPRESLSAAQLIGFGVGGGVIVILAALTLIAVAYWGEPLPG